MKNYLTLALLVFAACKSSEANQSAPALPCAANAPALAKRLSEANGLGMDLTDPKTKETIATAKAGLAGTKVAFANCTFEGQGNDQVSFAGSKHGDELACTMAGGADAVKQFRHAAMELDFAKLKLDVRGTVQQQGERFALTNCTITAHE